MSKLDLSGEGIASDFEIKNASEEIFNILRIFDSPKDAAVALAYAHAEFIKASFGLEYKEQAIEAIDGAAKVVKFLISEDRKNG
jgi:hypothetical protein